jgi:hypothetical protein
VWQLVKKADKSSRWFINFIPSQLTW